MAVRGEEPIVDATRPWFRTQRGVAVAVPISALGIVVLLRLWLKWGLYFPGDRWSLTRNDYGFQSGWVLDVGNLFQAAGTPAPALITIVWGSFFAWRSDGLRGALFVAGAALGVVFNALLKSLSGPTPMMVHARGAVNGLNFPSGHVVYATVVFGALAWLAWRHRRVAIAGALTFLIVLMGPFRVFIGAHFVSDVVAGYLVGVAWVVPLAIVLGLGGSRAGPGPPV